MLRMGDGDEVNSLAVGRRVMPSYVAVVVVELVVVVVVDALVAAAEVDRDCDHHRGASHPLDASSVRVHRVDDDGGGDGDDVDQSECAHHRLEVHYNLVALFSGISGSVFFDVSVFWCEFISFGAL